MLFSPKQAIHVQFYRHRLIIGAGGEAVCNNAGGEAAYYGNLFSKQFLEENHVYTKYAIAKHIKSLQEKGFIIRIGPDKGGYWEVVKTDTKDNIRK